MVNEIEGLLPQALGHLANGAVHRPDLAAAARRGVRQHRRLIAGPITVGIAVLLVLGFGWVARGPGMGSASPGPSACQPLLTTPVPVWARAGFTGTTYPPFAYSAGGNLVAIVFGDPLTAPPANDHSNKILWVAHGYPPGDLVIAGRLEGADRTARIDTGASPGPSIVDMPAPGCWHLDLRWGDHTDTIDLRWAPR